MRSRDLLDRPIRETWRLWSALLIPPTLWGSRLLAGWTIAEFACAGRWEDTATYTVIQTAVILTAFFLSAATGWAAWSTLRNREDGRFDPGRTEPFLAVTGILSAAIFSLLIVVEGTSVYLVGCG